MVNNCTGQSVFLCQANTASSCQPRLSTDVWRLTFHVQYVLCKRDARAFPAWSPWYGSSSFFGRWEKQRKGYRRRERGENEVTLMRPLWLTSQSEGEKKKNRRGRSLTVCATPVLKRSHILCASPFGFWIKGVRIFHMEFVFTLHVAEIIKPNQNTVQMMSFF